MAAHLVEQDVGRVGRSEIVHLLRLGVGNHVIVELVPILGLIRRERKVVTGIHAVPGVNNTRIQIIVHSGHLLQRVLCRHFYCDLACEMVS